MSLFLFANEPNKAVLVAVNITAVAVLTVAISAVTILAVGIVLYLAARPVITVPLLLAVVAGILLAVDLLYQG